MGLESINPSSGLLIKKYNEHSSKEVQNIISRTNEAFALWKKESFSNRSKLLSKMAEVLRSRKTKLAHLMASEMGKVLKDGESEIEKCAWVCEYYAQNGETQLSNLKIETEANASFVSYQPVGIVLAIMPWNFPFWQVYRFLAPALMAGNTALLKHASNVTGCALAIEEIVTASGFPKDVFHALLIGSEKVETVIANENVKAVTLTGSTPAGKSVASIAGKNIKKTVLELGGSDAYIVLEDADLELAAKTCVASRLINNGQSCIAAKRFIVLSEVKEKFEQLVVENMSAYSFGDPFNDVDLGPIARIDLRDELHNQVIKSLEMGATCLLGGTINGGKGAYYPPTVLTNVKWGSPAYHEELFGPVASIIEASSEKEAISIANDTFFGLGAAVFTNDIERGKRIAEKELEAGCCFVNEFVKSDPRLPFGGVKGSGFGRELGEFGIKEFVNIKTVYIK